MLFKGRKGRTMAVTVTGLQTRTQAGLGIGKPFKQPRHGVPVGHRVAAREPRACPPKPALRECVGSEGKKGFAVLKSPR